MDYDPADDRILQLEQVLRAEGRAEHTSLERALEVWQKVADRAGRYPLTVDDYTNDLTTRDYLALAIQRLPPDLSGPIATEVAALDTWFREHTVDDDDALLTRYFKIQPYWGWWWRRIPPAGRLAEDLARDALSHRGAQQSG